MVQHGKQQKIIGLTLHLLCSLIINDDDSMFIWNDEQAVKKNHFDHH
jgi:hypothetical protein